MSPPPGGGTRKSSFIIFIDWFYILFFASHAYDFFFESRLEKENVQLRSILKQFLDGVSVNENVLSGPNPLLVINGKVNLNHVPMRQGAADKKVVIEAQVAPQIRS